MQPLRLIQLFPTFPGSSRHGSPTAQRGTCHRHLDRAAQVPGRLMAPRGGQIHRDDHDAHYFIQMHIVMCGGHACVQSVSTSLKGSPHPGS